MFRILLFTTLIVFLTVPTAHGQIDGGGSGSGQPGAEGFPNCNDFHEDPFACISTPGCDYRVGSGCDFLDPPIPWGCYLAFDCSTQECPENHECIEWDWNTCAFSQCQGCVNSLPPSCTPSCLTTCLADLNCDGMVGIDDLIELLVKWGPCAPEAYLCRVDIDGDGFVNVPDLIALLLNLGPCPGTECVWDVNGDGVVDESDLQAVISNLGPCEDPDTPGACPWDVNGDGVVDGSDVQAVATHFGPCP